MRTALPRERAVRKSHRQERKTEASRRHPGVPLIARVCCLRGRGVWGCGGSGGRTRPARRASRTTRGVSPLRWSLTVGALALLERVLEHGAQVTGAAGLTPAFLPFAFDLLMWCRARRVVCLPSGVRQTSLARRSVGSGRRSTQPRRSRVATSSLIDWWVMSARAARSLRRVPSGSMFSKTAWYAGCTPRYPSASSRLTSSSTMSRAVRRKAIMTVRGRSSYVAIGALVVDKTQGACVNIRRVPAY